MSYQRPSGIYSAVREELKGAEFQFNTLGKRKSFRTDLRFSRTEDGDNYYRLSLKYDDPDEQDEEYEVRILPDHTSEGELRFDRLEPTDSFWARSKEFELVNDRLEDNL